MKIEKIMKLLSSETRLKLLAHFYSCSCNMHGVNYLVEKVGTTQANVSKQLNFMQKQEVIFANVKHKKKFYQLNPKFREEHKKLLNIVLVRKEFQNFYCLCNQIK